MTITELRYVVALAKENHFGRAAERVNVSQPTLSIGVKKLEEELGIQIFERLSGKVIPTKVGEKIVVAAEETIASTDVIRSIAHQAKGDMVGDIKLGIIFSICPYLLPRLVPHVRQIAPELNLYIEENYTAELINRLKEGELDVAITSLPVEKSSLLKVQEIGKEDFVVILPKSHVLAKKAEITFQDLVSERVFVLGKGNCFREQVIAAYEDELSATQVAKSQLIIGGSLETIRVMVKSGMGVSIFPSMAINDDPNIVVKPFNSPKPYRKIALVYRKSFIQADVVKTVSKCVETSLATK